MIRSQFWDGDAVNQKEEADALDKSRQVTVFWNAEGLGVGAPCLREWWYHWKNKVGRSGFEWDEFGFGDAGF